MYWVSKIAYLPRGAPFGFIYAALLQFTSVMSRFDNTVLVEGVIHLLAVNSKFSTPCSRKTTGPGLW